MASYENPWTFDGKEFDEIGSFIGFVYCVTNLTNGKRYIGKKNFYFTKTKQIKGKKKRTKVESDWRSYYGSNKELLADVALHGEGNFNRNIIRLCTSKTQMSYYELREQMDNRVLESDDWYNEWIMVKVRKTRDLRDNVS